MFHTFRNGRLNPKATFEAPSRCVHIQAYALTLIGQSVCHLQIVEMGVRLTKNKIT